MKRILLSAVRETTVSKAARLATYSKMIGILK